MVTGGDRMRTEEREGEKFFFLFRLYKQKALQVGCNENVRDRMRYFNKWKSVKTAEGENLSSSSRWDFYSLLSLQVY